MPNLRIVALVGALIFAGCATQTVDLRKTAKGATESRAQAMQNLCTFGRQKSQYAVTSVINIRNSVINGDVSSRAQLGLDLVYSAIATPRAEFVEYEDEAEGFCSKMVYPGYSYATFYPDCPTIFRYELGDVYGIGRGPDQDSAEQLAMTNCERAMDSVKSTYDDLEYAADYDDLECIVRRTDPCE